MATSRACTPRKGARRFNRPASHPPARAHGRRATRLTAVLARAPPSLSAPRSGETLLLGAADGSIRQCRARDGSLGFAFASGMSDVNLVSFSCDETYIQARHPPRLPPAAAAAAPATAPRCAQLAARSAAGPPDEEWRALNWQASGDKDQTFVIDVRRPDRAVHVLQHDAPNHTSGQHVNGVSAAWCHRSRTTLVTGSDDSVVRIWDVALAEPLLTRMEGHASPVSCVAISPEDELIASGGDEGKVVLYSRAAAAGSAGRLSVGEEEDLFLGRSN